MGAKKKGGDKKKPKAKKEGDEEDLSVENFWKSYKKKCLEYNCDQSKIIKGYIDKFLDDGEEPKKFHIWEELGWPGVKAIIEGFKTVSYPHCQSLRLWKTYCEDEGVRSICSFLERCSSILCLELLDNKVTYLGCEFLGKCLTPGPHCPPIMNLKLDHNQFGSRGVNALISGIQCNENLRHLQMKYCGIDKDGARSIFELLIFSKSKLEILDLTGNHLRNEGCKMVLNGVSVAKLIKEIHLADNQFNEDIDMLESIRKCMAQNKNLIKYDFLYNDLKDDAIKFFTEMLGPEEEGKISHVNTIDVSERSTGKKLTSEEGVVPEVYTPLIKIFKDQLALNKPKKKKGKKGKKKKKKS